jgi:hypothetical protein
LRGVLLERHTPDGDRVEVRHARRDRLAVSEAAAALVRARSLPGEPERARRVRGHEERPALRVERVPAVAAGRALEDAVEPVRLAAGGAIGLVDLLEDVLGRIEGDGLGGHRHLCPRVRRDAGIDGRRDRGRALVRGGREGARAEDEPYSSERSQHAPASM